MKKYIIFYILGIISTISFAFAAEILTSADIISYKDDKTVAEALDELLGTGTAESKDVLDGKTTLSGGEILLGSMPNNGAWTSTPTGKGNVSIPAGYHDGTGYVNTNLVYQSGYDVGYDAGVSEAAESITSDSFKSQTITYENAFGYPGVSAPFTVTFDELNTIVGFSSFDFHLTSASRDGGGTSYGVNITISGNTAVLQFRDFYYNSSPVTVVLTAFGY